MEQRYAEEVKTFFEGESSDKDFSDVGQTERLVEETLKEQEYLENGYKELAAAHRTAPCITCERERKNQNEGRGRKRDEGKKKPNKRTDEKTK
jgi:hypothetical protein